MSILLDGKFETDDRIPIDPSANLWRGQGWFETIALKAGELYNVHRHVNRLTDTLPGEAVERLDWQRLQTQLGELVQLDSRTTPGRVKFVVWQEDDGFRHAAWISSYDPPSPSSYRNGVELDVQMRSHPPRWPLSHEKRTAYASVMEERRNSPGWDVLYCDLEGNVWETGVSNVLWMEDETIYSPRMDGHWLPGTVLESIFEVAEDLGIETEYRNASWDDLGSFCWVTNSLVGMLPIRAIATEEYDTTPPSSWLELRERLLSDKVFPQWYEDSLFS